MSRLMKSKVGIICPTCNRGIFLNKLIPSIKYITELSSCAVWLLNLNGHSWDKASAISAAAKITSYGFEVRYIISGVYEQPVPIIKMREDCAKLYPEVDLYMFIDDDFEFVERTPKYPFTSGRRYEHVIDYMSKFQSCGVVNVKSFLGGTPMRLKIIPTRDGMYATNRGTFFRNMSEHGFLLAPEDTHHLVGGLEETLMTFERIRLGYFCATQYNNPTIHITGKLEDYDDRPDDFHNMDLIDKNIGSYLKRKYDSWRWKYDERRFPHKLWQLYIENGGIEYSYKDPRFTVDYGQAEEWDLK